MDVKTDTKEGNTCDVQLARENWSNSKAAE